MNLSRLTGSPVMLFAVLACLSLGLPRTMMRAVSSTLFLSKYPASAFAYVYLAVAVLIPVMTLAFMQLEKRQSPLVALLGLELTRLLGALALWHGFKSPLAPDLPMLAVVWVEIDFVLGSFMFWGLAGLCIHITESKSAFPRMSAGEQLGALSIGFLTPLILIVVRPVDLFAASALSILFGTAIILRIAGRFPELRAAKTHDRQRAGVANERPPPFNRLMRRYLVLILAAAFFSNLAYFVLDNLFYSETEKNFADEVAMTAFLGLAFGAAGGGTLLFSLFIAPRVLARFGVGLALSWLPALLTGLSASLLVAIFMPGTMALLPFAIVTGMKLFDDGMRASIYRPSFQTLYQPIPPAQRVRVLAATEGYAEPLGIASAGVLLLGLTHLVGVDAYLLTALLLVCVAGWLLVTSLLRRGYIAALSLAVSRRQNIETGFSGLTGDEARQLALEKLASSRLADRLSAADMLRKIDPAIYREMVPNLLRTADGALLRQILPDLPGLGLDSIDPVLHDRLERETDPDLRGNLVLALAGRGDVAARAVLVVQSAEPGVLQAPSLAALITADFGPESAAAAVRMRQMAREIDPASRRTFLSAAVRSGSTVFDEEVIRLFEDPDPETRRASFHAAGRTGREVFRPALSSGLAARGASQENANAMARALAAQGEDAIPMLAFALALSGNRTARIAAAHGLGLIGAAAARDALVRALDDAAPEVGYAAAMSLWKAQVRLDAAQSQLAFAAVAALLQRAALAYQAQAAIGTLPGAEMLHAALQYRITQLTTQSFVLAALTHGIDSLKSVRLDSATLGQEEKSVAVELVDSLLPPSLRKLCAAIVVDLPLEQRLSRIEKAITLQPLSAEDQLAHLVAAESTGTAWVRACALTLAVNANCANATVLLAATLAETGLVGDTARDLAAKDHPNTGVPKMSLSTLEKVLFLRSVNLFKSIPDEYLAEFAPVMLSEQYVAGEIIITEGEFGASLYIIVSGEVEVVLGGKTVATLGERAVVGELAALDPERRTATVRAVGDCHVLTLTNQHIGSLMAAYPGIAEGIIRQLCASLRDEHAQKRQRLGAG